MSTLPRETRDYVPLMIAAARIAKDPARYGFAEVEFQAPLEYEEVEAGPGTALEQIARAVAATAQEITRLNLHLRQCHVPTNRSYPVRVPAGGAERFAANRAAMKQEQRSLAQAAPAAAAPAHQVRRGENLTVIARQHGVSVNALRSANGLSGDRIRAGQTLRLPAR